MYGCFPWVYVSVLLVCSANRCWKRTWDCPRPGVTDSNKYLGLNLGPLQEPQMHLRTKPSLQPQVFGVLKGLWILKALGLFENWTMLWCEGEIWGTDKEGAHTTFGAVFLHHLTSAEGSYLVSLSSWHVWERKPQLRKCLGDWYWGQKPGIFAFSKVLHEWRKNGPGKLQWSK